VIVTNDSAAGSNFSFPLTCNVPAAPAIPTPAVMVPTQQSQTLWLLAAVMGLLGVVTLRRMR